MMSDASLHTHDLETAWQRRLDSAVDLGIAASVLVAPLFMGGRGPLGRFVFIAIVCGTAATWCLRQAMAQRGSWRWSGAEWLLAAGLGVVGLQLLPLPRPLLELLSPGMGELLPLWLSTTEVPLSVGTWTQASLHPAATTAGLAVYIAYALLFLAAYQRLGTLQDVHRLLKLIACATCFAAVVALLQFLLSNGKFLWLFQHPSRTTADVVKGTFQNQNHLAQLLALGIGPLLWWLSTLGSDTSPSGRPARSFSSAGSHTLRARPEVLAQALWVAFGVVMFAALLTFSRGGVIAILIASTLALGIIIWKQLLPRRGIMAVGVVAGLMLVALGVFGYEPLARKLGTLQKSGSLQELSGGRAALWESHARIIPNFWPLGTGAGTHRDIYPTFMDQDFNVEFTHGESSYMQLLVEMGLAGTGLVLFGLYVVFRAAGSTLAKGTPAALAATSVAVVPGLVASAIHSVGDFVWYIPACMTTTILLIAVALRVRELVAEEAAAEQDEALRRHPIEVPQFGLAGLTVVCLAFAVLATSLTYRPARSALSWHAYRRAARKNQGTLAERTSVDRLSDLGRHLEDTVSRDPKNARAHLHLAGIYLQRFDIEQLQAENPMPLSQIRDAALASQFPSREAMNQWIDRAVGTNRQWLDKALHHARQGVMLCPLQGEGYTFLASLAFLESPVEERKSAYVRQALATRPHDGRVLYVAGQEEMLAGDLEQALTLWKRAFQQDSEIRDRLLRELAASIPPAELIQRFDPDVPGCIVLQAHYLALGDVAAAQAIMRHCIPKLEAQSRQQESRERAATLRQLSTFYAALNALPESIAALQQAVAEEPSHFETRRRLARLLLEVSRATEAMEHLQWCAHRRPEDQGIRDLLTAANRGSLFEARRDHPSSTQ